MVELDIFEPRTMLEGVMQMKPAQRFVLDNFFPDSISFDTINVDYDIQKDKRRMAPFTNPNHEGPVVDNIGFKTRSYKPAYCKPKMRTTAQQILKTRTVGSPLLAAQDPVAKAAAKLGADYAELDAMIARREEWMALRSLQDGELTIVGDGENRVIDFDYDPDHLEVVTEAEAWNDHTEDSISDPIRDLLNWRRLVLRDSGMAPTDVILGNDAALAFLNHPRVKDWFNRWNFVPGTITVSAVGNVIDYGFLSFIGMRLYTLNEWFIDPDDGLEYEMLDGDTVLLLTRGARTTRLYGAIQDLDGLVGVPRFPKTWTDNDPSVRWAQLHSAPLPAINQPDAFFTSVVIDPDAGSDT
jgi:hypothetical protein